MESPGTAEGGGSDGFFSESDGAGVEGAVCVCEPVACAGGGVDCAHTGSNKIKTTKGSFRGACIAEKVYPLSGLFVIAKMLVVFAAALVAASERGFDLLPGMLALHIFEGGIHFAGDLVEFQAAGPGMQGGLEA